jgi:acetyltransferase-like isoleucine patch superfamily enzyme
MAKKPKITVGKNKVAEPNVRIGVMPSRKIHDLDLSVGPHANLRSGTILYLGSQIGSHLQTGHNALIREENRIGDHFSLWSNSIVDYECRIGNNVKIHCNCYIAQFTVIEDDVFIAPGVVVANDLHPGTPDALACMKGPVIKKGAQIGCNVTILPHVTIGEHALIGAGSVVSRNIPAGWIAFGNPAKPVKKVANLFCRVKQHMPYHKLWTERKTK